MEKICPFVDRECTPDCCGYVARQDGKEYCGVISALLRIGTALKDNFKPRNAAEVPK